MASNYQAVLFDLDGTLVDTAPDLGLALNLLLIRHQREPIEFRHIRPQVSNGSVALVTLGFGIEESASAFNDIKKEFLEIYQDNIAVHSRLFEGMDQVLARLEKSTIPWGVVTNKPGYLTERLLNELGLGHRAGCVFSGDTLAHKKPHPAPMFAACKAIDVQPHNCLYVGDARRDIESAHAAGMRACAALYGYYPGEDNPDDWNADFHIDHPGDLLDHIRICCVEEIES